MKAAGFANLLGPTALAVLLLAGCGSRSKGPFDEAGSAAPTPARSEVELGPVRVSVEVDPPKARLSDEPTLTLKIDYEQGVTVQDPPFGESLGNFVIRDYSTPLPQIRGDREIRQKIYTLEPTRTGKLAVWPISVTFTDTRPNGDGKEHTVETEGLEIEIESMADSEAPSLDELRPAAGPVELPSSGSARLGWVAAGVLLAAIAGVAWWRRARRRRAAEQVVLSPQELAYLELSRLLEEKLAERDVKLFYVGLTGVVRRYIERTTGVRAPEQTTGEFLHQIARQQTFAADDGRRLKDFLEAADLVKFAAHRPRKEDIEESFERAKAFLALAETEAAA